MAASLLTQMEQEALALPESQLQEKNTQTETSVVRREDRLHFTINDFDPSSTDEPAQIRHRGDCEFAVQADAGKVFKGELIRVDQPQTLESELPSSPDEAPMPRSPARWEEESRVSRT